MSGESCAAHPAPVRLKKRLSKVRNHSLLNKMHRGLFCLLTAGCAFFAGGLPLQAAPSRVDLVIESVQVKPPHPAPRQPVNVSASIRNNGSEPAGDISVTATVLQNGEPVRTIEDVPVLSNLPRLGS